MQLCCTPFPIWNQSIVPRLVLTVPSWPAYRFLRRLVRWSDIPISLRIFNSLLWSTQSKALAFVKEAEVDVFLEFPCFLYDPTDVGNFISSSSVFFQVHTWDQEVLSSHALLKPSLKDFEHNLASMWNECNCTEVWIFFVIALLWDWNEHWPFPVLWPLLSFPNLLAYWVQHFHSIIF